VWFLTVWVFDVWTFEEWVFETGCSGSAEQVLLACRLPSRKLRKALV